ncbi:MAG: class I SAM-dependent RNA methyltransferase [Alphaproteobacteria bacterium]|nr:class I SAM-dependent RNA methyltransferase [Alphaproteobacteria bacterium]
MNQEFEILLVAPMGLEAELADEAREQGFAAPQVITGGVLIQGSWRDIWRANLVLRGCSRVLVRIGSFRVGHLAQLDKLAHAFPWQSFLRAGSPVSVEATCKKSKIYHSGAAAERISKALQDVVGAKIDDNAALAIKVRIERALCTISIDTSGEMLHKRGHKEAVGKAPMRETLAASILRRCGYKGQETVVDPMCGSGTFVIEAAEMALGLQPGRNRNFAFEYLPSWNEAEWTKLQTHMPLGASEMCFYGSDRDAGAITASKANSTRAGVSAVTHFECKPITALRAPPGPPGLVICNPPYGTRIGDKKPLFDLYASLGKTLQQNFKSWRVGLVTPDSSLAKATGLAFAPPGAAILHGGLRVYVFQSKIEE